MRDPMETTRHDDLTPAEQAEQDARQMDRDYAAMAAERDAHAEAFRELQRVRRVLRAFVLAPISASSLQPVLSLAHDLCPSLRAELDGTINSHPF